MVWTFSASDAVSARRSRAEFVAALRSEGCTEAALHDAEVVFGELIGNVARHAHGTVSVELRFARDTAVLRVRDTGRGFALKAHLPDAMSEYGRGMYLVHKFAKRVTIERHEGGTVISVTMPLGARGTGSA